MSYLNFILNHLIRIKKLVRWISFGNVILSDVARAVLYIYSIDIVYRKLKAAKILVSNSHYKSLKHGELEMAFGKKLSACKLGDLGEARSMYI